jgi:hypothetical protein
VKHLSVWTNGGTWCDERGENTDEVFEADCVACLREAASYGAKAAVRCMAVEGNESADEELKAERDAAIAGATRAKKALMDRGLFVCEECGKTRSLQLQTGYQVPGEPPLVWCADCKAKA